MAENDARPARALLYAVGLKPRQVLKVRAQEDGKAKEFEVLARIDTPEDVEYLNHGGVLPYVLRQLLHA